MPAEAESEVATGWSEAMCASWRGEASGEDSAAALAAADPTGLAPLHVAALRGHAASCATILDAAPDAVNAPDVLGRTPLIHAATGGSAEAIGLLLERGAKLEWTSRDGKTALHWAVIAHRAAAVEALVNAGASTQVRDLPPEERLLQPNMKERDEGKTPLDYASERMGKDPIYKFLADYLRSAEEARSAEGPAASTRLPEPPWIAHARATLAAQQAEGGEAAADASPTAPAVAQPASDIFDEADCADEAATPGHDGGGAEAALAAPEPTPPAAADLDELD